MMVSRWLRILRYQHQICVKWQVLAVAFLWLGIPFIVSLPEIDTGQGAMVTEFYVSLIGFILVGTVNLAEANSDFEELFRSKPIFGAQIYVLRVIWGLLLTAGLMVGWAVVLHHFNRTIGIFPYAIGGLATACLWGSVTAGVALISKNGYPGLLTGLAVYTYVLLGMSPKTVWYPLALLGTPAQLIPKSLVVLGASLGVLGITLGVAYYRDN
ncbi:hypothetical protein ACLJJ6_01325 [Pediococcus siamensis]|uniref:hypothetical protein n=1 Tax=Pediococcus siamensis TaxID=381829 RepID=UPI0039A0588E